MKPRLVKPAKLETAPAQDPCGSSEQFPPETVSKRLLERLAKSRVLREKSQEALDLDIQVKVLNAVVKGINREQSEASIWIALDADAKPGQRTDYYERAISACISAEKILWRFGYTKTRREEGCETDECGNVIQAQDGRVITSLVLVVRELQEESYDAMVALKAEWSRLNKLLPPEGKRPAYKKVRKK